MLVVVLDVRGRDEIQGLWDFVIVLRPAAELLGAHRPRRAAAGLDAHQRGRVLPAAAAVGRRGVAWLGRRLAARRALVGRARRRSASAAAGALAFRYWVHTVDASDVDARHHRPPHPLAAGQLPHVRARAWPWPSCLEWSPPTGRARCGCSTGPAATRSSAGSARPPASGWCPTQLGLGFEVGTTGPAHLDGQGGALRGRRVLRRLAGGPGRCHASPFAALAGQPSDGGARRAVVRHLPVARGGTRHLPRRPRRPDVHGLDARRPWWPRSAAAWPRRPCPTSWSSGRPSRSRTATDACSPSGGPWACPRGRRAGGGAMTDDGDRGHGDRGDGHDGDEPRRPDRPAGPGHRRDDDAGEPPGRRRVADLRRPRPRVRAWLGRHRWLVAHAHRGPRHRHPPPRRVPGPRRRRWRRGSCSCSPSASCRATSPTATSCTSTGPGSIWTIAGFFKVFGVSMWTERVVGLLQLVLLISGVTVHRVPVGPLHRRAVRHDHRRRHHPADRRDGPGLGRAASASRCGRWARRPGRSIPAGTAPAASPWPGCWPGPPCCSGPTSSCASGLSLGVAVRVRPRRCRAAATGAGRRARREPLPGAPGPGGAGQRHPGHGPRARVRPAVGSPAAVPAPARRVHQLPQPGLRLPQVPVAAARARASRCRSSCSSAAVFGVRRAAGRHRGVGQAAGQRARLAPAGPQPVGRRPAAADRAAGRHRPHVVGRLRRPSGCCRCSWPRRPACGARAPVVAHSVVLAPLALMLLFPHFTYRWYADYAGQSVGYDRHFYSVDHDGRSFYYGRQDVGVAAEEMFADIDALTEPGDRLIVGPGRPGGHALQRVVPLLPAARPRARDPLHRDGPRRGQRRRLGPGRRAAGGRRRDPVDDVRQLVRAEHVDGPGLRRARTRSSTRSSASWTATATTRRRPGAGRAHLRALHPL